jgi:hypothetical protein
MSERACNYASVSGHDHILSTLGERFSSRIVLHELSFAVRSLALVHVLLCDQDPTHRDSDSPSLSGDMPHSVVSLRSLTPLINSSDQQY